MLHNSFHIQKSILKKMYRNFRWIKLFRTKEFAVVDHKAQNANSFPRVTSNEKEQFDKVWVIF